jgi:hypothetical protein
VGKENEDHANHERLIIFLSRIFLSEKTMARIRLTLTVTRRNKPLARQLAAASPAGLNRAADFLVAELRKVVSIPTPYHTNRRNLDAGLPPFKRTGRGMESIHRTATGRISMLAYMVFLDFGTRRIKPRPWYHVTIERLRQEIIRRALT